MKSPFMASSYFFRCCLFSSAFTFTKSQSYIIQFKLYFRRNNFHFTSVQESCFYVVVDDTHSLWQRFIFQDCSSFYAVQPLTNVAENLNAESKRHATGRRWLQPSGGVIPVKPWATTTTDWWFQLFRGYPDKQIRTSRTS